MMKFLNHIIEFAGNGVKYLSIDKRLTISNMTTEWGALGGVFPIDEVTTDWISNRIAKIKSSWIRRSTFRC